MPEQTRRRRRLAAPLALLALLAGWAVWRGRQAPPAAPAWFAALRPGDPLRMAGGLPSRKLTLAGQTRNALFAGTALEFRLSVPKGAELELAAGLRCAEGALCRGAVRFEVRAEAAGPARVLARFWLEADWREDRPEALPLQGPATQWHALRLPLSDFAGRELRLSLVAEPEEPASAAGAASRPSPFWAEPLLLAPAAERPNILLVSLDTLRADRLGCYGYRRDTSPSLDRLAHEGLRFEQALAQAPWTTPSHMSLFTGLYPSTHGVTTRPGVTPARRLAPGLPTLAALLRARGYQTRAYTGGGAMGASFGFDRGFDLYADGPIKLTPTVREELGALLRGLRDAPFFLYFHTFEVHAPYTRTRYVEDRLTPAAREDWGSRFDLEWLPRPAHRATSPSAPLLGPAGQLSPQALARRKALLDEGIPHLLGRHGLWNVGTASDLYDGGVRAADDFLGELLALLAQLGLERRTAVIVTSDHGEEFGEHDPGRFWDAHCVTLYDELLHVPLILRLPNGPTGVVRQQVRLIDVAPTLLDWLGLPPTPGLQGRSLLPLARGEAWDGPDWALAEATCTGPEAKALRRPDFKYIAEFDPAAGAALEPRRQQLFDLRSDPGERRERSAGEPERSARLRAELLQVVAELRRAAVSGEEQPLDEAALERLRALGYVR